jgi:hypothetical protein
MDGALHFLSLRSNPEVRTRVVGRRAERDQSTSGLVRTLHDPNLASTSSFTPSPLLRGKWNGGFWLFARTQVAFSEFGGISWKNLPFPFPRNGVSVLDVNYTFKTEPGPDAHIPDLPTLMSASPPILLTSFSRRPPSEGLPELSFVQLSTLELYVKLSESVWTLLKSLRAPLLAKLTVVATSKLGNIPAEPLVQLDTLQSLRILVLSMSACWFLPFLMALPAREKISSLTVAPLGEDEEDINHRTLREKFFHSPMQFEGLQDLNYSYSYRAPYSNSRGPDPWFLSIYGFSSARNHVRAFDSRAAAKPLSLPNARRLSLVGHTEFVIEAPALEHLSLPPLTDAGIPGDLSEPQSHLHQRYGQLNHIFFSVKVLELKTHEYTVLASGDLIPFSNVKTLILTGFPEYGGPDRRLFRWVSNKKPGGGSYLPQLSELVIKANTEAHRYKIVLEATRDFLVRRQEQGYPIGIVALSSIPHCLRGNPVLEWFRQNRSFSLKLLTQYIRKFDSSLPGDYIGEF